MLREHGMLAPDVRHTEIGSVGGFIGRAVLADGQGAMVGAGLGPAAAVGIWLACRQHLVLNPGSPLTVRLQRPIRLAPALAAVVGPPSPSDAGAKRVLTHDTFLLDRGCRLCVTHG